MNLAQALQVVAAPNLSAIFNSRDVIHIRRYLPAFTKRLLG
jgi:hypothetical protein